MTQRPHSSLGYRTATEVGAGASAALMSESKANELAVPVASSEAAFADNRVEVHPITGDPVMTGRPRNRDAPNLRAGRKLN
jgi:hypothetical protein